MNKYTRRAINVALWLPAIAIVVTTLGLSVLWVAYCMLEASLIVASIASLGGMVFLAVLATGLLELYNQFTDWLIDDWYFWKYIVPEKGIDALFTVHEL